jgi:hypothetical protein
MFYGYALRDGELQRYARIAQFRIVRSMPAVRLLEAERLDAPDRGRDGSTDRAPEYRVLDERDGGPD